MYKFKQVNKKYRKWMKNKKLLQVMREIKKNQNYLCKV